MRAQGQVDIVWLAVAIALGGGCGTEPSDDEPGAYRLVATDSSNSAAVPCFASSSQYVGGELVRQAECDVALGSFEARFDSTATSPELVLTAGVRHESGDTATWQVSVPIAVRHSALEYDFSDVVTPFADEQMFILPRAGTLVSGVLTLQMFTFSSSGMPDRTEYFRPDPTVFVLTLTGRPPAVSPLAGRYVGVSFAGMPAEHCVPAGGGLPAHCIHRSFTLSSAGGSWVAAYDEAITVEGDTVGGHSVTASNLTVRHPNAFVRVSSSAPPSDPFRFEAQGSLVRGTLTLFPSFRFLDGTPLVSPIVAVAD